MAIADPTQKADRPALSEHTLQRFIGYRIRRAWLAIQADLAETLRPFDLRMITYTALAMVHGNPGLSQAQLADLMQMERPNLVAIVDELQRRGLLLRKRATHDRRAYALSLTSAGEALFREVTEAVARHEAQMADGLTAAERATLSRQR